MRSLFARRDYRHLFTAQLAALAGTGATTVALGLLAYRLAGPAAGAVLGTALTLKMITYVTVAPLASAYAVRLPRRSLLVALDLVRAATVLTLPLVDQVWQIYVLIVLLQSASAAFTPTFQAVLPDILPDERDYTRGLSAAQMAATMETLLSPLLAAVLLSFIGFHWLFLGTALGFLASAALVVTTRIPDAARAARPGVRDRTLAGLRIFAATPRLRGLMGLNLAVAAAGAVVMVDTVNYARDVLGGDSSAVAILFAANGFGTMAVALTLPRVLDRVGERAVMTLGAAVATLGTAAAVVMTVTHGGWPAALAVWALIGVGTGMVLTPTGRILRRSAHPTDRPTLFAAQFSLSHLCWLVTYPIAGWLTTTMGFASTWIVLSALAALGSAVALRCWPRRDPAVLTHVHVAPGGTHRYVHAHPFVIDDEHRRWPRPGALPA
ncbi:MFS transporter [Nocardia sp. NPDC004068]|uniref:MFS transporter n=1 Tax=Nocardia sp. NPDC004068 TaxID=3364303 RepID=UPI0036B341C5